MKPSEVRQSVLKDHVRVRERLARISSYADSVVRGGAVPGGALRNEAQGLLDFLVEHMAWEEQYLVPLLRDADAWGDAREERFEDEHREQREMLAYTLERLQDMDRPDVLIARNLLDLVDLLREDMDDEEAAFLDPNVVRDDPVAIDLFAG